MKGNSSASVVNDEEGRGRKENDSLLLDDSTVATTVTDFTFLPPSSPRRQQRRTTPTPHGVYITHLQEEEGKEEDAASVKRIQTATIDRTTVRDEIFAALQVVGTHAHRLVHPSYNLEFHEFMRILDEVAQAIAHVNQARLQQQPIGSPVSSLPTEEEAENMKQIVEFGVGVATKMLAAVVQSRDDDAGTATTTTTKEIFDVFISYAGEEGFLYVPMLYKELEGALTTSGSYARHKKPKIFFDKEKLVSGDPSTADPPEAMLSSILSAKTLVFVTSFHFFQKKWPVMEFLCGLARLKKNAHNPSPPPIIIDAMPGEVWMVSAEGKDRPTSNWVDDVKELYTEITLPALLVTLNSKQGLHHIGEVVQKVVESIDQKIQNTMSSPNAPYEFDDNDNWIMYRDLVQAKITQQECQDALYTQGRTSSVRALKDGTFVIRKSNGKNHVLTDNVEKQLCKLIYVKNLEIRETYWFYDTLKGKFVLVPVPQTPSADNVFGSFSEILQELNLNDWRRIKGYSACVKSMLTKAVEEVRGRDK